MSDKRIEKLEQDLENFRKDFAEIGKTLRQIVEVKGNEAASRSQQMYDRFSHQAQDLVDNMNLHGQVYYARAREQLDNTLEQATDRVRENPLQSIAVVAGVSFLVGFLLSRR